MSNETEFDTALREQEHSLRRSHRASRRRNLLIWLLAMVAVLFGAVCLFLALDNAGLAAANSAYGKTQQQEKQNLAVEGLGTVCQSTDPKTPAEASFCQSLETAAAEPPAPQAGPQGVQGLQGIPGRDGAPGKDSTVPGPAGKDGADSTVPGPAGKDGAASTVPGPQGLTGPPGADSTVPGPAGPQGEMGPAGPAGAPGKNGASPSSFTFTDRTGATYTCTPNPPGSSTYTCSSGGPIP